jgi:molybdopterin molybdotransferase
MNASSDMPMMIEVAAAREIAVAQITPVRAVQDVPLHAALGRTCARDVTATSAMPFFTNSAMDGFALLHSALAGAPTLLPVAGTVAAGDAGTFLPSGTALRIFTGAPLPHGADTVVPFEDTSEAGGSVWINVVPDAGANLRHAGSDQPLGACLVACGTRIAPHHVGLLAANGITRIAVIRRPRVVVLSTGNELTTEGSFLAEGQIYDANRPMVLALAQAAGCEAVDGGTMLDEVEPLSTRLADLCACADLVLSSGGVSIGGRDPLRPAFVRAGGEIAAWRVAVKPGKPVMFGRMGETAFTGLPGNPLAALVGFHLFVAPQIERLTGAAAVPFARWSGRAASDWRHRPGRQEIVPVRCLGTDGDGLPLLERLGNGVSATLFPLANADGLAVIPTESEGVAMGERVNWHPFRHEG